MDHSYFSGSGESKLSHQDVMRWKNYGSHEFNNNRGEGLLGRWLESAAKYRGQWAGKHWPRPDTVWSRSTNWQRSENNHNTNTWSRSASQKPDWSRSDTHNSTEIWPPRSENHRSETWTRPEAIKRTEEWPQRDSKTIFKYRHREELDAAEALTFLSNACA